MGVAYKKVCSGDKIVFELETDRLLVLRREGGKEYIVDLQTVLDKAGWKVTRKPEPMPTT